MLEIVLAGGPGSGKTTTLTEILRRFENSYNISKVEVKEGFYIHVIDTKNYRIVLVPEAARHIIMEYQKRGIAEPWRNRDEFQRRILELQLKAEKLAKKLAGENGIIIYDRGLHDGLAYYKLDEIKPPEDMIEILRKRKYDLVLLLEIIPGENKDGQRWENYELAKRIESLVEKSYKEFGMIPIRIKVMPIEERTKIIWEIIDKEYKRKHSNQ